MRHSHLRSLSFLWRPLGRFFRRLQSTLRFPRTIAKRVGRHGPFRFDGRFAFSDFSNWGHGHNSGFDQCIEACTKSKVFLDVGAHIGLISLPASRAMPTGQVFAFEPSSQNRGYLETHLVANGIRNVEVVPYLVGDRDLSDVAFYEMPGDSGLNTQAAGYLSEMAREIRAAQITIDRFVETRSVVPDLIKIDVEGAELRVISGAEKTLRSQHPRIFLSVHPKQMRNLGDSPEALGEKIRGLGYGILTPEGENADSLEFGEYLLVPSESEVKS